MLNYEPLDALCCLYLPLRACIRGSGIRKIWRLNRERATCANNFTSYWNCKVTGKENIHQQLHLVLELLNQHVTVYFTCFFCMLIVAEHAAAQEAKIVDEKTKNRK